MAHKMKTITVLGSTGSVGRTTVKLLLENRGKFEVKALAAGNNWKLLAEQARLLSPSFVAIDNSDAYRPLQEALDGENIQIGAGPAAVIEAAKINADWVMAGIVGVAGLPATVAAVRRGALIAFANKECLVSAGGILIEEAKKSNAKLIPVDSEHNAIFQVFENDNKHSIDKIILTASGGPFRTTKLSDLELKTPEAALAHPNWEMGAKISIDSATMMNKGLEIIEACFLFAMPENRIDVVVHPQSIVHSLVAYKDGSLLAQLGSPDMVTPIAYSLAWPERMAISKQLLDLTVTAPLTFEEPDTIRFPALSLARESIRLAGNSNLVLNAANEIAVKGFLSRQIKFTDIIPFIKTVLDKEYGKEPISIDEVLLMDRDVRKSANHFLKMKTNNT
jgi:1-deoxy-D-xylulose-5-phosphate reductoisomerase